MRRPTSLVIVVVLASASAWSGVDATDAGTGGDPAFTMETCLVPAGSRPHDVSPAIDGGIWFTAQGSGDLGLLDPVTGTSHLIDLGDGSRPTA